MLNFMRSPTLALMVAWIFWSKSKNVLRREVSDSEGLSVLFDVIPILTCTLPWVFS